MNNEVITLPWREFKAFTQIYDTRGADPGKGTRDLLAVSATPAGQATREQLLKHGLIRITTTGADTITIVYQRGVPLGRDFDITPESVIVAPRTTSSPGA